MSGSVVTDAAMARPAAHLAPLVRSYVGYRFEGFAPGTHLGLPSRHLTVVLSLGAPIRVAEMPGEGQRPAAFQALLGGLHTRPARIAHDGDQYGVQLELTPLGARSLLGLPAGALGPAVVDLGEFLGPTATELCDRMASAPDWTARFALLDRVLGRRAGHHDGTPAEVARAWHIIVGSGGTARVGEVATEVGWSRRHLGERFAREYGLTPKAAARVVRFGRSRVLLGRADRPSFAAVAATCGYADQSHLDREWNALAGCPPSAWLAAEELPSVQDMVGDGGAG